MRVALVSPMPPARTGIADYAAALAGPLADLASVDIISDPPARFDAAGYDAIIYQIGNNEWHESAYEMALEHPGIVVLHEANLHYLVADLTIKRGRWDLYLAEAEYNGGAAGRARAERAATLAVGPDYDGLPMTRRLLERARAVIVHSRFMAEEVRAQGYTGPLAVIPHGAWIPEAPRNAYRFRLGLDERAPLIGIFGYLKPYKRIAESLRAFRRLLRVEPDAKMILGGEEHPDFPLAPLIRSLGIGHAVRLLGFVPGEDLPGYIAACDIVLNLRFPTVGESSGTLLRALGLGRAVLVSDIGSFREYPDDICLKVETGAREEDLLFEYLNLLVSRPSLARAMGARARAWVERECNWPRVAGLYLDFARAVRQGSPWPPPAPPAAPPPPEPVVVEPEYILGWATSAGAREYTGQHRTRLARTLELTPPGAAADRILEMGAYLQITPALKTRLGYGEVRGCYYGEAGRVDHHEVASESGEPFAIDVELFDAERDPFPYTDEYFSTVLCCELLEHLKEDPMHMLAEIHRILRPGGHLLITTPNLASLRALNAILMGYHPGFFPAYLKPSEDGPTDARHAREYTPKEIWMLLHYAGFDVVTLETGEFLDEPHPDQHWVRHLLERYRLDATLRGDGIYALGRKVAPLRERYPAFLYSG
jgi:glycosyltransferase involved in cell wall biosynthesis/SAM-dependent methyltransferase